MAEDLDPIEVTPIEDQDPTEVQDPNDIGAGESEAPSDATVAAEEDPAAFEPAVPLHEAQGSVLALPHGEDGEEDLSLPADLYEEGVPPTDEEWDSIPETPELIEGNTPETEAEEIEHLTEGTFETEDLGNLAAPVGIKSYEVQGRPGEDAEWTTLATVDAGEENLELSDLPVGAMWEFRIRSVFHDGRTSEWSAPTPVAFPEDMIAPGIPSALVATGDYAAIGLSWDGLDENGQVMPKDFARLIIWDSPTGGEGTWTRRSAMSGPGDVALLGYEVGETIYFSATAMDEGGNESGRSAISFATRQPLAELADLQAQLDAAQAEADQKWEDFAGREQEFQDAVDTAISRIEAAEQLFESMPEPLELEEAIQQAQDAIAAIGDVGQRLDDAEQLIETRAQEAAQNLADLNTTLGNSFTQGINTAKQEAAADAQSKADAAKTAAENAAKAHADLVASGAEASAIAAAAADATAKANAAKTAAENAAKTYADAQRVAAVNEAAQNAQAEYDRLQAAADQALDAAVTGGGNLYPDPSFELGGLGLNSSNRWSIVEDSRARHGSHVLRIETDGSGAIGFMTNHATWSPGNRLYAEAWIMRTSANQTGGVRIRVRRIRSDTTDTGLWGNVGTLVDVSTLPVGEWTKITGQYVSTEENLVGLRAHMHVEGDGPVNGLLVDSFKMVDITAANEALQAAQAAQSRADAAHSLAGTAESNAQLAMTAAGQKTRVSYSTSAPSGTASEGDVWRRVDSNGDVYGEWVRVGNSWQSRGIRNEMISNLDVGKLTAGSAVVGSAVIQKLWTDGIAANTADLARVTVASRNLIGDPDFTTLGEPTSMWSAPNAVVRTLTNVGPYLDAPNDGSLMNVYYGTLSSPIAVNAGETYKLTWRKRRQYVASLETGEYNVNVSYVDYNGAHVSWHGRTHYTDQLNGQDCVFEFTVPDDSSIVGMRLYWRISTANAGFHGMHSPRLISMTDGSMVVEDSITADKIHATSEMVTKILGAETAVADVLVANSELWARSATLIAAEMETLTVTEKANFVDAFADQFMANSAVVRELLTSRLVVAADNFAPDPGLVPEAWADSSYGFTVVNNNDSATGNAIRMGQRNGDTQVRGPIRPVRPGDVIRFRGRYTWWGGSDVGANVQLRMEWFKDPKGTRDSMTIFHTITSGTSGHWAEAEVTVPDGITYARFYIYQPSTTASNNAGFWGDMDVRSKLGGQLIVPGTITGDILDADSIWANNAFLGAAKASALVLESIAGNYTTRMSSTGLEIFRRSDGEDTPVVSLGGSDMSLTFSDASGEATGSIQGDGAIAGSSVSAGSYNLDGRDVFGDLIEARGVGSVLDVIPRGEVLRGERDMTGLTLSGNNSVLFMEGQSNYVKADRSYLVVIEPFMVSNGDGVFLDVKYTLNGNAPIHSSSGIGMLRSAGGGVIQGSLRFTPETDGFIRVGLQARTSGSNRVSFPSSFANVKFTMYDMGLATSGWGMPRNSYSGNLDQVGLTRTYHSAWTPTWYQVYRDGSRYTWPRPLQGRDGAGRTYASQVGGYNTASSMGGLTAGEQGRTIAQALSGAELLDGTLTVTLRATPAADRGNVRAYYHTNNSAPSTFSTSTPSSSTRLGSASGIPIAAGSRAKFELSAACLAAISNGTFRGFSFHPSGSTQSYFGIEGADAKATAQPVLRLRYKR